MKLRKQNEASVCLAGHHVYRNNTPIVISVRGLISSMNAILFRIEKKNRLQSFFWVPSVARSNFTGSLLRLKRNWTASLSLVRQPQVTTSTDTDKRYLF